MGKSNHYSDGELLQAIRLGNNLEAPIKYLYAMHFDSLANFIRINKGNQQDAEDVFQEMIVVFIDLIQREKFRGDSSIKTFLYAIVRNLWLNELKKRNRTLLRDTEYYDGGSKEEAIHDSIEANDVRRQIFQLIEQLGEICKRILVYFYYDNLPMKEIVARLDYENEQVVRNRKYKCMKRLGELLDGDTRMKNSFKELLMYGT
ncbi:MAG: sigma-70 family RNA polymerase sigma factor [Bacteroidota bacterium]